MVNIGEAQELVAVFAQGPHFYQLVELFGKTARAALYMPAVMTFTMPE